MTNSSLSLYSFERNGIEQYLDKIASDAIP